MYSLDTHTFLWWLDTPEQLKPATREIIEDPTNLIYVSAAVSWEITVKRALKKLSFEHDFEAVIALNNFLPLPITVHHTLALDKLPNHHRDPFDRILVAQALSGGFTLVTRDPDIPKYGVPVLAA
ncbi:type II toxin-antitoxin system VapC family toxin [Paludisphaera rhizosphaerae]|uniref:type II toxin-antitoxin system VapC family toxin n=1 Tax=Paludisphaera rhizosphaerae TaxID=2711216 RepID=UPI0013EAC753|nr:type II toxin-antitoxin system VapC family toxin [Paludisphaera rhizosphaerae]